MKIYLQKQIYKTHNPHAWILYQRKLKIYCQNLKSHQNDLEKLYPDFSEERRKTLTGHACVFC